MRKSASGLSAAVLSVVQIFGAIGADAQKAPTVLRLGFAFPQPDLMPLFMARQNGCLDAAGINVQQTMLSSGDKITFEGQAAGRKCHQVQRCILHQEDDGRERLARQKLHAHSSRAKQRARERAEGRLHFRLVAHSPLDQRFVDEEKFNRLDVTSSVIKNYAWKNFAVRDDWAKANKGLLVGFIKCWIAGSRWMFDPANAEAATKAIVKETKIAEAYGKRIYMDSYGGPRPSTRRDGELDPAGLQAVIDAIVEQGDLPASPSLTAAKFMDDSYWKEAMASSK